MTTLPGCSTRTPLNRRPSFRWMLLLALILLLAALCVASICVGSVSLTPGQVWSALWRPDEAATATQIVRFVRLPRVLAAVLSGSALAVSGLLLQAVLGNALASPSTIGVNAGAGLMTLFVAAVLPQAVQWTPVAAFVGALGAALLVYLLAARGGASRMTIILAGVAVSSFLGAMTDTLLTLFPDAQMNRVAFMIGGYTGVSLAGMGFARLLIPAGLAAAWLMSYDLNILTLGEETARSLGLRTGLVRGAFLLLAALLAGCAVSFSGLLGFIGLIVPHAVRFFLGQDHRFLVPGCLLSGAAFALGCDLVARTLFAPYELPVGIVMSALGGPFFLYLLLRQKRGRLHAGL